MNGMFALNANVFIEACRHCCGLDLCPGFWMCLRYYGGRRRVVGIDRVRAELLAGRDALSQWVKDGPDELFVSSAEPEVVDAFAEMMVWVRGNGQFRPEAKAEFAAAADGWLAYAKVHGAIGVTHAQYSPNVKRRVLLGNVCRKFGVVAQDTFETLRELEVRFDWRNS